MAKAEEEIQYRKDFDLIIVNDVLEDAKATALQEVKKYLAN